MTIDIFKNHKKVNEALVQKGKCSEKDKNP
jgi:hypothetical protein